MKKNKVAYLLVISILFLVLGAIGTLISRTSSDATYKVREGGVIAVSDRKIKEQEIRFSVNPGVKNFHFAVARAEGAASKTSRCLESTDLICVGVTQIREDENDLFSIETNLQYVDDNGNYERLISTTNFEVETTRDVVLQINDGRWTRLYINDRLVQAYRYAFDLGVTHREDLITVRLQNSNSLVDTDNALYLQFGNNQSIWNGMFYIGFFVSCILSLIIIVRKSTLNQWMKQSDSVFQQIVVLSGLITVFTYGLSSIGFFGHERHIDSSGILFSRLVRFSDFFEVWSLSEYHHLYASRFPDYPPAMISLLGVLKYFLVPEHALVIVIGICLLTQVNLFYFRNNFGKMSSACQALFFSIASAPFLFAIDRGGLDLLVYPLIVLGIIRHSQSRFELSNRYFVLAGTLKLLPIVFLIVNFRKENGLRKIFSSLVALISLNLLAAVLLPEKGITELFQYSKHLFLRSSGEVSDAMIRYNNSAWSLMRAIQVGSSNLGFGSFQSLKLVWIISMVLLVVFVTYWIYFRSETASGRCVVVVCTMLLVVPMSANYRLLYLYPAIWYLDKEGAIYSPQLRRLLVVIGSLLLSVSPIYFFGQSSINIGQLIKPCLLLCMIMIVCYSDISFSRTKLVAGKSDVRGVG